MATQPYTAAALTLITDGAALQGGAALSMMPQLEALARHYCSGQAGVRLHSDDSLRALLKSGAVLHDLASTHLGAGTQAVRAILFDKTVGTNWTLGWHQDRTIAVKRRHELAGFGPWTDKSGILHVEPPFPLIERMVTLRVHLDDTPENNAPLLIARGSHRLGRIAEGSINAAVERCGTAACIAERGDVWVYATPIIHASDRAKIEGRRRVLQVDFSADPLPAPLEWFGV